MIQKKIWKIVNFLVKREKWLLDKKNIVLVKNDKATKNIEEIANRLKFYSPETSLSISPSIRAYFSRDPVLLYGQPYLINPILDHLRYGIFDIDFTTNPLDGWEWSKLAVLCANPRSNLSQVKFRFNQRIERIKKDGFSKSYIFGTGPSLGRAETQDWSDGYRIVCNTIVRNQKLWNHIDPHFIVAGDAIYHFGHTLFARTFREDLARRMSETDTCFLYPDSFDPIVQRELKTFSDRLFPIPVSSRKQVHQDLTSSYSLPGMGNVLPLLLIPLGCTLSKNIFMWGFDGRAPDDKLFWSNSKTESYPELLDELKKAHPAFFNHYIPREDPFKYVKEVHGDILDISLTDAENEGFRFTMMHHSWTPVLQKRASYDEVSPKENLPIKRDDVR
jgi:hypothetical protein